MFDVRYAVGDFMDLAALIGYRRAAEAAFSVLDEEVYDVGDFMHLAKLRGYERAAESVFSVLDDEELGRVVEELEDQYALARLHFQKAVE